MKASALSFTFCSALGVLLAPTACCAPVETPAKAFRISAVAPNNQFAIEPGTSEFTVRRLLGEPPRRLSPETWVYERYAASDWKIDTGDCSTLIITFAKGEVVDLKLVNRGAEKAIAAGLKKSSLPQVAEK